LYLRLSILPKILYGGLVFIINFYPGWARFILQLTRQKELTDKEKENNRKISKVRVKVEHAISGIKRSRSVKDVLRNTKEGFSDLVMVIACSLHNLRVDHRNKPLKL